MCFVPFLPINFERKHPLSFLVPRKILKRLIEELQSWLKEKTSVEQKPVESEEIQELTRDLTETVKRINDAGYRTIIIIDALNKVDESGQTTKVMPCKLS